MSDGPDKTLGMRSRWKIVARVAAKDAYETTEVCQRLAQALKDDWQREVTPVLRDALRKEFSDGRQSSLFADQRPDRLDALRRHAAGSPLGNLIIDCAIGVAAEGAEGPDALQEAVKRALLERAQSGTRQVETHYRCEAPEETAANLRRRLDAAVEATDFGGLAAHHLDDGSKPPQIQVQKQTGIEDGPRL